MSTKYSICRVITYPHTYMYVSFVFFDFLFYFLIKKKKAGTHVCNHCLMLQGIGWVSAMIPLAHNMAYHYSCPRFIPSSQFGPNAE